MEHFIEDDTPAPPTWWDNVLAFFKRSETIFLARVNGLVGIIMSITTLVDPALLEQVLTPRTFAFYMIGNGVLTEIARRLRAPNLGEPQ